MKKVQMTNKWPKSLPVLTEEQERIRTDFLKHWLEVLPNRFGVIEQYNHRYPLRTARAGQKTLEIGAGLGTHLKFENLAHQQYTAMELRPELGLTLKSNYPSADILIGDCQKRIDFPDSHFDRVLAIHVLEHLPDLPKALDEIKRVLRPDGEFSVVIPCEGGMAYTVARNISARRIFEKRYKQKYDWFVASEHINLPAEIIKELQLRFKIVHRSYFPLVVPVTTLNLVIGLTLMPSRKMCKK
jgi:SAM-dependent methyltransferase